MSRMRGWKWAACAAAMAMGGVPAMAQSPVSNAFTYQGELSNGGALVNQNCDFEFRLFDKVIGGTQQGATVSLVNQAVTNGRFAVSLDFGAEFYGEARWLEIRVKPSGLGFYTTLAPRQELTATPYALGLRLPFQGVADENVGSAFEIINNDMGWAATFRNDNPANTDAALNVTSMSGPAAQLWHELGGMGLVSRNPGSGTAVLAEIQGTEADSTAIYGAIQNAAGGSFSTAVRGENFSLDPQTIGVWGSSDGSGYGVYGNSLSGRGVFGETTSDFGWGVYGRAAGRSGVGVYGEHSSTIGVSPGVHGLTASTEPTSVGVRGEATGRSTQGVTYGVLGTSSAVQGVGVRGDSYIGVEGDGDLYGVRGVSSATLGQGVRGEGGARGVYGIGDEAGVVGEAGDVSSFGVWAIGSGSANGNPALRADNSGGAGIFAFADRAIEGEGTEFGVRGVTWEATGVGGTFTNYADGGVALSASGRVEVAGTISCNVLEIQGADLAEKFPVSEPVEPGTVVSIDPANPGKLRMSRGEYNRCVAGIVSGANGLNAGTILGHLPGHEDAPPIALSGRVWVKCDARSGAISPGDLLTTSETPGHAMVATDAARMNGAVLGKAMTALAKGQTGLVLVLVNLQ